MKTIYRAIKKDNQIKKFCLYGFLKNLRFFEPYLYIYLLQVVGLNLFQIGTLFSIREAVTYLFEIPSGILADQYGKKNELVICFIFYILSFFFFYLGNNYFIIAIAMFFFGLGEAFRSGTHKAMIYTYLEYKKWFTYKTFVYGRTRSFSLIGSSFSAFAAIFIIIWFSAMQTIFLFSIIPYILDFFLILSYPNSLNERVETTLSLKKFFVFSVTQLRKIFSNHSLKKVIISSSLFDGIFKILKDYIQPILKNIILISGVYTASSINADARLKIILGMLYGVIYIFSSVVSRNVYRLNFKMKSSQLMDISFDIFSILFLVLFFAVKYESLLLVIPLYFIIYFLKDGRRPLAVDVFGDRMPKTERATVLSVESQARSLFMIVLAPVFGYIADVFGISKLFFMVGLFLLVLNRFLRVGK